jgi:multidrug efflux pump subunit AcrB
MSPRALLLVLLGAIARRRLAVGAAALVTLVLAGVVLTEMPLQLLPEIRYPQVRIIGDLPGQTSRVIEESINEPMEAALAGVPGIVRVESRSGDGRAYIDLFFEPDYDLDRAYRDVTQAAQRAQSQIPAEFPAPRIFAVATTEQPVLQFAFGSSRLSPPEIRQRLRASLLPRLRAIPGVDAVHMGREEVPELVVDIDPARQAALGIPLDVLEAVLREATDPPASGAMRTPHFEGIGVLDDDGWEPTRLAARRLVLDDYGRAVALGEIARVHTSPSEEALRTRLDGHAAVLVSVHRSPQSHALRVADEAKRVLAELAAAPGFADIEATILYDDSVVTRGAVRSVVVAAVGGAVLAMLLLFFTLRQRRYVPLVALVVGASLAASLVVLFALGVSLNLLTLAGLLLSVGLGLDYAIIYFDRLDRSDAAEPHLHALADVAGPLLGALLTTLAAVLPFLLVQGLVALLFRPLILTVMVSAVFSFLSAVVLLPAFARRDAHAARDRTAESRLSPGWWARSQRPAAVWGAVVLLGGVFLLGMRALPFEVLPVVDDGFVDLQITHPVGIPMAELDALTRRVEAQLAALDGTDALFTTVGGYFREGLPAYRPGTSSFMVRVDTRGGDRPSAAWADDARRAIAELGATQLRVSVTLPRIRGVQTRLADADLIVVLTSADGDLLALSEVESEVVRLLRGVPGLVDVERRRGGVSPRWVAVPRYMEMAAHGVEPAALRRAIEYALEGRVLRQRMHNGEPLVLRARYDRVEAGGPQHLASARLPTRNGGDVPLADVVEFTLVEEPTHIERRENQRVVRIGAGLDPAGPGPGTVAERVQLALAGAPLPAGVSWWLEGEVEALEETRRTFAMALALALLMVLTLLIMQYGSFTYAAAALITIPLSGVGTVLLLWLTSRPLDAMVLAGLLIAIGIVANNVILVLSQTQDTSTGPGALPLAEALRRAARDRFRPIVLTVLSTVLGMSPLLLGGAEVFGLLQPLAIALTGALLLSVPLASVLLPGLVLSIARLPDRARELARRAQVRLGESDLAEPG